jgi:hypothetical protein
MKDNYWKWLGRGLRKTPKVLWGLLSMVDYPLVAFVMGFFSFFGVLGFAIGFHSPLILLGWVGTFFLFSYPIYKWEKEE